MTNATCLFAELFAHTLSISVFHHAARTIAIVVNNRSFNSLQIVCADFVVKDNFTLGVIYFRLPIYFNLKSYIIKNAVLLTNTDNLYTV